MDNIEIYKELDSIFSHEKFQAEILKIWFENSSGYNIKEDAIINLDPTNSFGEFVGGYDSINFEQYCINYLDNLIKRINEIIERKIENTEITKDQINYIENHNIRLKKYRLILKSYNSPLSNKLKKVIKKHIDLFNLEHFSELKHPSGSKNAIPYTPKYKIESDLPSVDIITLFLLLSNCNVIKPDTKSYRIARLIENFFAFQDSDGNYNSVSDVQTIISRIRRGEINTSEKESMLKKKISNAMISIE